MTKPSLIIAELKGENLSSATRAVLSAAQSLHQGNAILWLIGTYMPKTTQTLAASLPGIGAVWLSEHDSLDPLHIEHIAAHIADHRIDYHHVLMAATTWGKSLLPRLSALLDCEQQSNVVALSPPASITRPCFAGKIHTTLRATLDARQVLSICHSNFTPMMSTESTNLAPIVIKPIKNPLLKGFSRKAPNQPAPCQMDLSQASIVVAGGRGIGGKEGFEKLAGFAKRIHATLGASRAAVDAGFVPNHLQIGQTGQTVAPKLYIAVGISGAIQHTAGISGSHTIIAINNNPSAPIFAVADIGMVMDWEDALVLLESTLLETAV